MTCRSTWIQFPALRTISELKSSLIRGSSIQVWDRRSFLLEDLCHIASSEIVQDNPFQSEQMRRPQTSLVKRKVTDKKCTEECLGFCLPRLNKRKASHSDGMDTLIHINYGTNRIQTPREIYGSASGFPKRGQKSWASFFVAVVYDS